MVEHADNSTEAQYPREFATVRALHESLAAKAVSLAADILRIPESFYPFYKRGLPENRNPTDIRQARVVENNRRMLEQLGRDFSEKQNLLCITDVPESIFPLRAYTVTSSKFLETSSGLIPSDHIRGINRTHKGRTLLISDFLLNMLGINTGMRGQFNWLGSRVDPFIIISQEQPEEPGDIQELFELVFDLRPVLTRENMGNQNFQLTGKFSDPKNYLNPFLRKILISLENGERDHVKEPDVADYIERLLGKLYAVVGLRDGWIIAIRQVLTGEMPYESFRGEFYPLTAISNPRLQEVSNQFNGNVASDRSYYPIVLEIDLHKIFGENPLASFPLTLRPPSEIIPVRHVPIKAILACYTRHPQANHRFDINFKRFDELPRSAWLSDAAGISGVPPEGRALGHYLDRPLCAKNYERPNNILNYPQEFIGAIIRGDVAFWQFPNSTSHPGYSAFYKLVEDLTTSYCSVDEALHPNIMKLFLLRMLCVDEVLRSEAEVMSLMHHAIEDMGIIN